MGATAWTPTWLSLNKALAADEAFMRDVLLAAKHEADKATAEDADGGERRCACDRRRRQRRGRRGKR
jgi:hypothetical protein